MGLLDRLKGVRDRFIGKRECKKLIKYQGRTLAFGAKGGVAGSTIELTNFKTDEQRLEQASELALAADDYQYRLCELYRSYPEDSPEFVVYLKKQEAALRLLTSLNVTLATYKVDPAGQRKNLEIQVRVIQKYFNTIQEFRSDQGYI